MHFVTGRIYAGCAVLLVLALSLGGCASDLRANFKACPKPLSVWEQSLIEKYTATVEMKDVKSGGAKAVRPSGKAMPRPRGDYTQLRFIVEYNAAIANINTENWAKIEEARAKVNKADLALEKAQKEAAEAKADHLKAKKLLIQAQKDYLTATEKASLDVNEAEAGRARASGEVFDSERKELALKVEEKKAAVEKAEADVEAAEGSVTLAKAELKVFDDEKRTKRNAILAELILLAKAAHEAKDDVLHYGRATGNITLDAAQLISTGLASVTGSESTARALAAFATGVQGFQESVDKRVFYEHATAALLSIMNTQRMKQETVLIENMRLTVEEYSLEQGLDDWATYLLAGGLTDALRELSGDAGAKELVQLEALQKLKKMTGENIAELAQARADKEKRKLKQEQWLMDTVTQLSQSLDPASAAAVLAGEEEEGE